MSKWRRALKRHHRKHKIWKIWKPKHIPDTVLTSDFSEPIIQKLLEISYTVQENSPVSLENVSVVRHSFELSKLRAKYYTYSPSDEPITHFTDYEIDHLNQVDQYGCRD